MLFDLLKDYAKDNSNNQTYNYTYKEWGVDNNDWRN